MKRRTRRPPDPALSEKRKLGRLAYKKDKLLKALVKAKKSLEVDAEDLILLSIDPSSNSVGYAVFSLGTGEVLESGTLISKKTDPIPDRLASLFFSVEELMEEFSPALTAIELIHKRKTHVTLLRATGALMAALAGVPLLEVDPELWHSQAPEGYEKSDPGDAEEIAKTIYKLFNEIGGTQ